MKLIGSKRSRAFRALWMLEELGLGYDHDPSPPHGPEVIKVNPSGKIPALLVDGSVITDSTAILTYLSDVHGRFTQPAGSVARARQDAVTGAILDEVEGALWTASKHSYVLPKDKCVADVVDTTKWEYERSIARLGDVLEGPFLMGEDMSVPDFILVHCLGWAKIAGFPDPGEKMMAYLNYARARDGYKRAAALP